MRKMALLIVMFGLLAFCQPMEAGELTFIYSNDTDAVLEPIATCT